MENTIKVEYTTSVCTPAGWRSENVLALAKKISEKRCEIVEILDIGGNGASGYASRTGAKRQQYSVGGTAKREIGKIKNLSSLTIIE